MTDPQKLTPKALSRLQALAKGNGIAPDSIQMIESKEEVYAVPGIVTLTPDADVKTRQSLGRVKAKGGIRILGSFTELQSEIQAINKRFQEDATWYDEAIKELEKTPGHGWGHEDAHLAWNDSKIHLAATENCPVCRGTAQHPCQSCRGLGQIHCVYCEGRGQELCLQCGGTGHDPQNPQNNCPTCNGSRFSLCRFCHGRGKRPCETCQGKGHAPCTDCQGTGAISQEVIIHQGAQLRFSMGSTSGLPSGLLRLISRLGDERLAKGSHADIEMTPVSPDDKKNVEQATIKLAAKIPYADIKMKFGTKAALVACFGKKAVLSGVPPFLDESLSKNRALLRQSLIKNDQQTLNKATEARALKEALALVLAGKTHPNHLRALYPAGLSINAAKEIMENFTAFVRQSTIRTRLIISGMCLALSSILSGAIYMTPLYSSLIQNQPHYVPTFIKAFVLLASILGTWAALRQMTVVALRKKFGAQDISANQAMGKTGYAAFAAIIAAYLLILYQSGHLG